MTPDLAKLRADLSRDEGRRRAAYKDSLGFWTIGVGHLIDGRKGGGLPDDVIDILLDRDAQGSIAEIANEPWFLALDTEPRARAVANMYFQLRHHLYGFVKTLDALARKDWKTAAACLRKSLWAKQTPNRAARLIKVIEDGVD